MAFYQGRIDLDPQGWYYPNIEGSTLSGDRQAGRTSEELKSNIVIIDDDVLVLQALRDCVESAGYAVDGFSSAEEFLASGARQTAACLIVDIQLPGITGLELQGKLAGADNRLPIVFVSAQGTNANREKAMRQGASGFLSKPFRREDLLKILGEAIAP